MAPLAQVKAQGLVIGGWRGRNHLFFEQASQRRARGLSRLHQLRDLLIGLLIILSQDVTITDGLEVDAGVVRGDDGQGTLDARVQRPPKSLAHLATQRSQAAPKGATRLDPLNLQGLADGTSCALQRVMLPSLGLERRLHYD